MFKVTSIGDAASAADSPKSTAQAVTKPPLKATVIPSVPTAPERLESSAERLRPTAMPAMTGPDDRTAHPITPSAVPGIARLGVVVSMEAVAQRYPALSGDAHAQIRSVLATLRPEQMAVSDWLKFGVAAQEDTNSVLKERVALVSASHARAAGTLLRRLHEVLTEVIAAVEGGFLRKSARVVWAQREHEVRQIDTQLAVDQEALMRSLTTQSKLKLRLVECQSTILAHYAAGEFVIDRLPAESASVLLSRLTAITGSQALAQQGIAAIEQDEVLLQELVLLIQDGVLVKLPAMYGVLAALGEKINETERFMTLEKLSDLTNSLTGKLTWHWN